MVRSLPFKAAYLQEGTVYLSLSEEFSGSAFLKLNHAWLEFEKITKPKLNLVDHDIDLGFVSGGSAGGDGWVLLDPDEDLSIPGEHFCWR